MARHASHSYPFSAIVGQEELKLALLLNAVDPRVGGVLIRGERGTAKSTAVRALAAVLPPIEVVEECIYSCDPARPDRWCERCAERFAENPVSAAQLQPRVVDLPVSATEDRVVGTLDFEAAIRRGEREFHPGLLAQANRGILYVDEVNLLDDHLVDTLLDAAAMGVNTVEREGVSVSHPARFILVGTMNPEEGELRPQLLDRFGLCVEVVAVREPESRVEIMRRRRAYENDPDGFSAQWRGAEEGVQARVKRAQSIVDDVVLGDETMYAITDLSLRAGVDGHRADTVMARAAAALAALEERTVVELADIERIAPLVLSHRLRRSPLERVGVDSESLRESLRRALTPAAGLPDDGGASEPSLAGPGVGQVSIFEGSTGSTTDPTLESVAAQLSADLDRTRRSIAGRRQTSNVDRGRGRYSRAEVPTSDPSLGDVAIDATVRAAASTPRDPQAQDTAVSIRPEDVRTKVRTRKVGASIVFCVDASGSMGASNRMEAAKGAVLELLVDAYQRRDRVSVVTFRGRDAEVVLAPTASVELASLKLRSVPTGGATPLAAGILRALDVIASERRRDRDVVPWLVLITDGRGNVGIDAGGSEDALAAAARVAEAGINALVVDSSAASGGSAAKGIAEAAGAEYVPLVSVSARAVCAAVRDRT